MKGRGSSIIIMGSDMGSHAWTGEPLKGPRIGR